MHRALHTLVACALAGALSVLASPSPAHAKGGGVADEIVGGPGIAHPVWLPVYLGAFDADLVRADPPGAQAGEPLRVRSDAWTPLLEWPPGTFPSDADALIADYYEQAGLLAVTTYGGARRWFTFGGPRRAVIDRYARLARAAVIGDRPTTLEADLAWARLTGELSNVDVQVDGVALAATDAEDFLALWVVAPTVTVLPSEFVAGAQRFGPPLEPGNAWPLDAERDIDVVICEGQERLRWCQSWILLAGKEVLVPGLGGLGPRGAFQEAWQGLGATPGLLAMIEGRDATEQRGVAPWLAAAALLAALVGAVALAGIMARESLVQPERRGT